MPLTTTTSYITIFPTTTKSARKSLNISAENSSNSTQFYTFVNGRPIKDNLLIGAIRYAYHDLIPSNRYPFASLHLEIPLLL